MQQFFAFLGLFAALLYGADFVSAGILNELYKRIRTGQTGGEINHYLSLSRRTPLLIMGDSRARYQVNPDSFELPGFSLCHAGMGQVFQTGLLHVLEKEKKLPSAILLHLDFEEYSDADNLEDIGNLRYYYRRDSTIANQINRISPYEKVKYLFRLYCYNGRIISTLKNFAQSRNTTPNGNGYQPLTPVPNDSTTYVEAISHSSEVPRFHYSNLRHLTEFIGVCKRNHVKLLCFTSPYFSAHRFATMAARPIDSLLAAQHVPYFNAAAHPLPVLVHHAIFWHDANHLNLLGAGYYSQQLAQWSKHYLIAQPANAATHVEGTGASVSGNGIASNKPATAKL